jgi:hypothetical protein
MDLDSRELRRIIGISRIGTALALIAVLVGALTSQGWRALPKDNSVPPYVRPAIADALPSDADVSRALGVEMLRIQDGPPKRRIFISQQPSAYDIRAQTRGAWQTTWRSADGRTELTTQIVRRGIKGGDRYPFTDECNIEKHLDWPKPFITSGIRKKGKRAVMACARANVHDTDLFFGLISAGPQVAGTLEAIFWHLSRATVNRVPAQLEPVHTTAAFPAARTAGLRSLLQVIILIPLAWSIPTLLFDRAFWQRFTRRFRSSRSRRSRQTVDVDVASRRLASLGILTASVQWALAIWTARAAEQLQWSLVTTLATVLGVVLLVGVVQRRTVVRRRRPLQMFRGRRVALAILAGLLIALAFFGAAQMAKFAVSVSIAGIAGIPDWVYSRIATLTWIIILIVVLLSSLPMMFVRRIAMRSLRRETLEDTRAPILLLRSFADDRRIVRARGRHRGSLVDELSLRRWERFEEVVAHTLGAHGPVLTVGQVGERLPPPLGAVRRQFTNEEWRTRVFELMVETSLICVSLGRSQSLAEEIERIQIAGHLQKTIFLLPPTPVREQRYRLAMLSDVLGIPWHFMDVHRSRSVLAVYAPANQTQPIIVTSLAQEDVAYEVAIDFCARLAFNQAASSISDRLVGADA